MDIQSTLTLVIEVIVMSFVTLMIFDFVDGLYAVPLPTVTFAQPKVISKSTISAVTPQFKPISNSEQLEPEPQQIAPQFEQLPDPWELELAFQNSTVETQSVVPFSTLRLLPPVQKVQPKRTRTTKKTTSTKTTKSTEGESLRKLGRPRKNAA
ncbi:hypothetical protein [Nostoc sp. TCL26-01]|uniref:hypothetical protein n=1 Tax=Nostoc sp. TCL26-01 TaxID=2576904 RepID=UPI0015BDC430|nr:hypothetical protein [Nostoc sp. TCL26-01]QLE59656.1 hypothetical protein FD725_29860 [Nostoc sp. TCL26-01]